GNFVVTSQAWHNGPAADAGAVTWVNATTGLTGVVSASNSLVGTTAGDRVGGSTKVTPLANGNYVVVSNYWDNGGLVDVGAVTLGNGATGTTGVVSATNSLIGSQDHDQIGTTVTALTNGNYVVESQYWDNGSVVQAGAATWVDGASGLVGVVSATNSLVGSQPFDQVGLFGVAALA